MGKNTRKSTVQTEPLSTAAKGADKAPNAVLHQGGFWGRPLCPVIVYADVNTGDHVEVSTRPQPNKPARLSVEEVGYVMAKGVGSQKGDHPGEPFTRFIPLPHPKDDATVTATKSEQRTADAIQLGVMQTLKALGVDVSKLAGK